MLPDHAFQVVTARPRCIRCDRIAEPGEIVVANPEGFVHASCPAAGQGHAVVLGLVEGEGNETPRVRGHLRAASSSP